MDMKQLFRTTDAHFGHCVDTLEEMMDAVAEPLDDQELLAAMKLCERTLDLVETLAEESGICLDDKVSDLRGFLGKLLVRQNSRCREAMENRAVAEEERRREP